MKQECIEKNRNSHIKCEENKRKIIFINKKKILVEKIIVDNCAITQGVRCDFLVKYLDLENFIELKGEDLKHAFEQIQRSIKILSSNKKIVSYIITSRSPLSAAEIQNKRLQFKRKLNSELIVKNNSIEVEI